MLPIKRFEQRQRELDTAYDLLSEKISHLRKEKILETDINVRFKIEKQLEELEQERESIEQELEKIIQTIETFPQESLSTAECISEKLPSPCLYQNLIPKNYTKFVGREEEIKKLIKFLSPKYGLSIITVDGIGGVGKTSLVLEVAYRCLEASKALNAQRDIAPKFDVIIFTSAKQDALTAGGILPRYQAQRTLRDIFQEISWTLDCPDIMRTTPEKQPQRVRENLARQRTLLIIDNLETIEDKQGVLSFLYELPSNVKIIITTRERQSITPIRLTELPKPQGLQLIKQNADEMNVKIDENQIEDLYGATGGIPAAIIYAIGQISYGYTIQTVLKRVRNATGDVARFFFQGSVEPLRGKPAHHLLMAIAMVPKSLIRDAIATIAGHGTDPIEVEEGLVQLQCLSLVTQARERYSILPLTREYALAELSAFPDFERGARDRWTKWYLDFVHYHGGYAQHEWHIHFDQLEVEWENILEVLDWCAKQELYSVFKNFWKDLWSYTHIYGYWDDRLMCLNWLIQAAERRGDISTLMVQLSEKGRTLYWKGRLEEALDFYNEAWKRREYNDNLRVVSRLAGRIAETLNLQGKYTEAFEWIDRAETIINKIPKEDDRRFARVFTTISYIRAEIYYQKGDYKQAELHLQRMIEESQALDFQYVVIWSQQLLAEIKMKENKFEEAKRLLDIGLPIMERNKDKFGIARYKGSYAYLEWARGNEEKMRRWACEALDSFEHLGAISFADKMRTLITADKPLTTGLEKDLKPAVPS